MDTERILIEALWKIYIKNPYCNVPDEFPPCGYKHSDGRIQEYSHPGCIAKKALEDVKQVWIQNALIKTRERIWNR